MIGRGGDRGQINFDFAVGVSIVMVAVILAFSFVPGVFGGVTEGRQQSDEVVADRIAENLTERTLETASDTGTLDGPCVRALFDSGYTACGLPDGVADNIAYEDRFVHVSVLGNTDGSGDVTQLYWDPSARELTEDSSDIELADGDDPSNAQEIGVGKRAVTIEGTPARIVVRVW